MVIFKKEKLALIVIISVTIATFIGAFQLSPVAQDLSYHDFIDSRGIFGVTNFWNVVSNIVFLFVGALGLFRLLFKHDLKIINEVKIAYLLLFIGVALASLGSAYYHLLPNNQNLVWDRLPMAVAFMALFSIIICEFISLRAGKIFLLPLIVAGLCSVLYWYYTETVGQGDLRYYIIVQFLPALIIPVILIAFSSRFTKAGAYWWLLMAYVAAKLFEHFDAQVFHFLGYISGHSIKHIIAALGLYILLASYKTRNRIG